MGSQSLKPVGHLDEQIAFASRYSGRTWVQPAHANGSNDDAGQSAITQGSTHDRVFGAEATRSHVDMIDPRAVLTAEYSEEPWATRSKLEQQN